MVFVPIIGSRRIFRRDLHQVEEFNFVFIYGVNLVFILPMKNFGLVHMTQPSFESYALDVGPYKLRQSGPVHKTSLRPSTLNLLQTRTGDAYVVQAIGHDDQLRMIFQSPKFKQRNLLKDVVTADPKIQNFYILLSGIHELLQLAGERIFPRHEATESDGVAQDNHPACRHTVRRFRSAKALRVDLDVD